MLERGRVAVQHLPDTGGGGPGFVGTLAGGALAGVEVVRPDGELRPQQRVRRRAAPPGLVHGHDRAGRVEQRDMGRQRVQDGGLDTRGLALRFLAGEQLFLGFVGEDSGHLRI